MKLSAVNASESADPPAIERNDALTELAVGDLLERPVQDQHGDHEQEKPEDRRTILPDPGQDLGQPGPAWIGAVWRAGSRHRLFDWRKPRNGR